MTPYIVLVDLKVVRNYVINNFKLYDQLSRINSQFSLQESLMLAKFSHFAEKFVFWSTLEAPSRRTLHIQELVRIFKVVANEPPCEAMGFFVQV